MPHGRLRKIPELRPGDAFTVRTCAARTPAKKSRAFDTVVREILAPYHTDTDEKSQRRRYAPLDFPPARVIR